MTARGSACASPRARGPRHPRPAQARLDRSARRADAQARRAGPHPLGRAAQSRRGRVARTGRRRGHRHRPHRSSAYREMSAPRSAPTPSSAKSRSERGPPRPARAPDPEHLWEPGPSASRARLENRGCAGSAPPGLASWRCPTVAASIRVGGRGSIVEPSPARRGPAWPVRSQRGRGPGRWCGLSGPSGPSDERRQARPASAEPTCCRRGAGAFGHRPFPRRLDGGCGRSGRSRPARPFCRAVGTVGANAAVRVGPLQPLAQARIVVPGGIGGDLASGDPLHPAHRDVRLVVEDRDCDVDRLGAVRARLGLPPLVRPARVRVLPAGLCGPDLGRGPARLDLRLSAVGDALARGRDPCGIHDLAPRSTRIRTERNVSRSKVSASISNGSPHAEPSASCPSIDGNPSCPAIAVSESESRSPRSDAGCEGSQLIVVRRRRDALGLHPAPAVGIKTRPSAARPRTVRPP